jgi:hypothetical protein
LEETRNQLGPILYSGVSAWSYIRNMCLILLFHSVNDILISLIKTTDHFAAAFAYISTQNDSLRLDSSLSFAPPVQYNLQAQTWSFINNDTKSKPPI